MQTPHDLAAERAYLESAGDRLRAILGRDGIGVYAGGSWALGDYVPGRSDLDLAAVVSTPLTPPVRDAVAARLRHESLACPARLLELVVYRLDTARSGSAGSEFELNLNTGAGTPLSMQLDDRPGAVGSHWFAIDRSVLSQAGVALWGPSAGDVFAPISPADLMPVVVQSLRWHRAHEADPADAALNACRALRYAEEGRWSSKAAAGRWVAANGLAPADLVSRACRSRTGAAPIDREEVAAFLLAVESRLEASPS